MTGESPGDVAEESSIGNMHEAVLVYKIKIVGAGNNQFWTKSSQVLVFIRFIMYTFGFSFIVKNDVISSHFMKLFIRLHD